MSVALRSATHLGYGSHTNPSLTVPSGVQSGDVVIVCVLIFSASTPTAPSITGFTAWPGTTGGQLTQAVNFGGVTNATETLYAFYKVAGGSEGSTYSATQAANSSDYWVAAYTGVDNTSPVGSFTGTAAPSSGAQNVSTAGSVTPTVNGSQIVIVSGDNGDTTNNLSLAGYTNEIASPVVLGILDTTQATAAATGSQTFTNNTSSFDSGPAWTTGVLVLNARSAPASTTPGGLGSIYLGQSPPAMLGIAGAPSYSGTGSGSFSFTGTATATVKYPASGSGSFAFSGSSTGTVIPVYSGSGTGSFAFTGTSTAVVKTVGTATGSFSFTGSATGSVQYPATGTGSFAFGGSATGSAYWAGTGSGAFSFGGSASGSTEQYPYLTSASTGNSSFTPTTTAVDTTGATLIVIALAANYNASGLSAPHDSANNTWTALTAGGSGSHSSGRLFYCLNPVTSTSHTFTSSTTGAISMMAFDAGGPKLVTDQASVFNSATTAQYPSAVSVNTSNLVVAALVPAGAGPTATLDSSFNAVAAIPNTGNSSGIATAYLTATSSGSVQPTWTLSAASPGNIELAVFSFGNYTATGSGSFGFTGSSSGVQVLPATASGAFAFGGTSTGSTFLPASGQGSFTFGGTATGVQKLSGSGHGAFSFGGNATGAVPGFGTGAGAFTFTGSAVGTQKLPATAHGTFGFTSTATGVSFNVYHGTAAGQFSFTSSATGVQRLPAEGAGSFSFTSGATGVQILPAVGSSVLEFDAEATGLVSYPATGLGTFLFQGSATGTKKNAGPPIFTLGFFGSSTGFTRK